MPRLSSRPLMREIADAPAGPAWQRLLQEKAVRLIEQENLVEPAICCDVVDLDPSATGLLSAKGEVFNAPKLIPEKGELAAIGCGVATLGSRLEQKVTALFASRQRSLALVLDQIGNRLLFALTRYLQDRLFVAARRRGLTMAGELRPGDPGLSLQAHGPLLRLAGAESIGVSLTRGHALYPLKSISMLLGAGIGLPPARWSRCDDCRSRSACKLVEHPSAVGLA